MTGDAEPPRMGQALAVADQHVRRMTETSQRGQQGGRLAKREQPGHVRKAERAPGDLLLDPAAVGARAAALAASGLYDTVCVHGDSPGSLALARAARAEIDRWNGSAR